MGPVLAAVLAITKRRYLFFGLKDQGGPGLSIDEFVPTRTFLMRVLGMDAPSGD